MFVVEREREHVCVCVCERERAITEHTQFIQNHFFPHLPFLSFELIFAEEEKVAGYLMKMNAVLLPLNLQQGLFN